MANQKETTFESEENQEQQSSLDILWSHTFRELDHWARQADYRDEVFLKEVMYFADTIKRNQGNISAVSDQFYKEFAQWEKNAIEEFLMSTTTMQHFFPIRSYEEMNHHIDQIQQKTISILTTPCQFITNNQIAEQFLNRIEKYIALRKKGRNQYIKTIKQAGNLIFESQRGFVDLYGGQIKAFMFPLNKYLEKIEEN